MSGTNPNKMGRFTVLYMYKLYRTSKNYKFNYRKRIKRKKTINISECV